MADLSLSQLVFRSTLATVTAGKQARLSILIYHRVRPAHDCMRPGEPTATEFEWQMRLLQRHFNILPLSTAVPRLRQNRLPPRATCITFDDGYADNATVALPILRRLEIPATVFVASGYLNGGRMWNDTVIEALRLFNGRELNLAETGLPVYTLGTDASRRAAARDIITRSKYLDASRRDEIADCLASQTGPLADDLMLNTAQLLTLQENGVEIGAHTVSHPILSSLTLEGSREEIIRGKIELEKITGKTVNLFAYPNGKAGVDYKKDQVSLVREAGFEAAVTTDWGVSDRHTDLFQLPRFTPWDRSPAKFLLRLARNRLHVAKAAGREYA